jgi:hypothetical protein
MPLDPERRRLADDSDQWRRWGPYLSERAWGTVREDYSADGKAWLHFPHDHARSRAYRWSEDGLGGIGDADQRLCLAFAFWNGRDPILKERTFGLTGDEGNHGEDVKELYWYRDCTPTHSWMRWRYVYPQNEFPYRSLVEHGRDRSQPELELMDTGVLDDDRYWDITVDYAKAASDDFCLRVRVRNAGSDPATLHVLPTLWFRNTWSWDLDAPRPSIGEQDGALVARDVDGTVMTLRGRDEPESLFCDNDTNISRLWPSSPQPTSPFPKDGINDHVVGARPTVNPARTGTKAALWYPLDVPAGETAELRLRLSPDPSDLRRSWSSTLTRRAKEADEFYAALAPAATPDERVVLRQAFAGMLWSKQCYHYDVERWLAGDPAQPPPPPERRDAHARNTGWRHVDNRDVISMPDTWEYPWFAAWDLAFHTITLAHVDPAFAKDQLRLITREWYMHPNGQLPAYEWNFGDVNPPVHALAALTVFRLDGSADRDWLQRLFHKLLLGFTWWANVKDPEGDLLFGGGFLGMDNVGPFNRSTLPAGLVLEQADGTGWMAIYCLSMLEMALVLAEEDPAYEDAAIKFFEHFTMISEAINDHGLWDEDDAFYYDRVRPAGGGESRPVRVRSMTGLIPLCAVATAETGVAARMPEFQRRVADFLADRPQYRPAVDLGDGERPTMLALVGRNRLPRILERLADTGEFLSPHGVRSLSAAYRGRPFAFAPDSVVDYEPAESTTDLFGGNSNWRGPVWFPVNHLIIHALRRYAHGLGSGVTVEYPAGSGSDVGLDDVATDLAGRLVSIFLPDPADGGRRPVFANRTRFVDDPAWTGDVLFHEYFHGDTGAGLGAAHQTGWTGLVADLIIQLSEARAAAAGA